ncbi:MAG TPA: DUF2127 domain-containing protein [Candidatus Acidoferrales bacterium]|nr:DUF2127 domain-containing protein [Candidatus Acidoferrales bacterium]
MAHDQHPRAKGLLLIAILKLMKGALLIAVGIGALKLLHRDVAEVVGKWIDALRIDPDNRHIHRLLQRIWSVDERKLKQISAGTFFYAALLLTEGFGLLLEKRWAESFTVIITSSFLPLEVYELVRRATLGRVLLLAFNVAVVWYLVARLHYESKHGWLDE